LTSAILISIVGDELTNLISPKIRYSSRRRLRRLIPLLLMVLAGVPACSPKKQETPQQRADAAKRLFEMTAKTFHIPSAEAKDAEKEKLQNRAADGYRDLLKRYPEQDYWAAQALRSLGNICASQGKLEEAVANYGAVEKRYPQQRWEVLMSWKTSGDLLWEAGQVDKAAPFYQKIVAQYDTPQASQVEKTIVRGSRMRLGKEMSPAGGPRLSEPQHVE